MPVVVTNKSFTDIFGNTQGYYKSNTGDQAYFTFEVQTSIRLSSISNPILFDIPAGELTSASLSYKDEGFRVGDTIQITKYDSGGAVLITWNATLQYFVNDYTIGLSSIQTSSYDVTAGEVMEFIVTGRNRDDLDILINHVQNGQVGTSASLLDGETSRISFVGVDSLAVSGTIFGSLVPNQK